MCLRLTALHHSVQAAWLLSASACSMHALRQCRQYGKTRSLQHACVRAVPDLHVVTGLLLACCLHGITACWLKPCRLFATQHVDVRTWQVPGQATSQPHGSSQTCRFRRTTRGQWGQSPRRRFRSGKQQESPHDVPAHLLCCYDVAHGV